MDCRFCQTRARDDAGSEVRLRSLVGVRVDGSNGVRILPPTVLRIFRPTTYRLLHHLTLARLRARTVLREIQRVVSSWLCCTRPRRSLNSSGHTQPASLVEEDEAAKVRTRFSAKAEALADDYVLLTIDNMKIPWKVGQHFFVSVPRCGLFQSHPFSVANLPGSGSAKFVLKAHSGFSRRLLQAACRRPDQDLRTFISSPYGSPPLNIVERCDSLILMATSTGASFTLPILQHTINKATSIRRPCFYWIVRHPSHLS
jgi:hypothetical protein